MCTGKNCCKTSPDLIVASEQFTHSAHVAFWIMSVRCIKCIQAYKRDGSPPPINFDGFGLQNELIWTVRGRYLCRFSQKVVQNRSRKRSNTYGGGTGGNLHDYTLVDTLQRNAVAVKLFYRCNHFLPMLQWHVLFKGVAPIYRYFLCVRTITTSVTPGSGRLCPENLGNAS